MSRPWGRKALLLERIAHQRELIDLERRILRGELDTRWRPIGRLLALGRQVAPLAAVLRSGISGLLRVLRPGRQRES